MSRAQSWLMRALIFSAVVLVWSGGVGFPALEDDRFWWIPQAWIVVERGLSWVPAGALPSGLLPPGGTEVPPQWSQGVPDFGHPPLFFWCLGGWLRLWEWGGAVSAALGGPSPQPMVGVQVGLLPLALLAGFGIYRLSLHLLPPFSALLATMLALTMPPVEAQLSRADLDLALLAGLPWALSALLARRLWMFACLSLLLVWTKEPGVLLASAPAIFLVRGWHRGAILRAWVGALPLLGLLSWAWLHRSLTGWALASPERVAPSLSLQLLDILRVGWFVLGEQGRAGLTLLALLGWLAARERGAAEHVSPRARLLLSWQLFVWISFFGSVNFLGGDPARAAGGHWRYLAPILPLCAILGLRGGRDLLAWLVRRGAILTPALGTAALLVVGCTLLGVQRLDRHGPPLGGVERNLFSRDLASAHRAALPMIQERLAAQNSVWVGSYAWVELTSPRLGHPGLSSFSGLAARLRLYHMGTRPEAVVVGAYVLESAHGEPLGRLQHALDLEPVARWTEGAAWVQLHRVTGRRVPGPEPAQQESRP